MKKLVTCLAVTLALYSLPATVNATSIMPDFANFPTGWTTDRYAPNSFSNVGTFQGRSDVLGIGISSAQGFGNRASTGQNSAFYNTQGKQHAISGAAGSTLAADLFINSSWSNAANGNVRTDMWGIMTNGTAVSGYPIIGFTNYGGNGRLRVFDGDITGGWVNLATPVAYDAWTSLAITFTGSSFDYFVNGNSVYSDTTIAGSTGFQAVIMQAYNFYGDPAISDANPVDYTANWSNSQPVPEPGTIILLGIGLAGIAGFRRKFKK